MDDMLKRVADRIASDLTAGKNDGFAVDGVHADDFDGSYDCDAFDVKYVSDAGKDEIEMELTDKFGVDDLIGHDIDEDCLFADSLYDRVTPFSVAYDALFHAYWNDEFIVPYDDDEYKRVATAYVNNPSDMDGFRKVFEEIYNEDRNIVSRSVFNHEDYMADADTMRGILDGIKDKIEGAEDYSLSITVKFENDFSGGTEVENPPFNNGRKWYTECETTATAYVSVNGGPLKRVWSITHGIDSKRGMREFFDDFESKMHRWFGFPVPSRSYPYIYED